MTDRELMQQALEALEAAEHLYHHVGLVVRRGEIEGVIAALRERLAQPETVMAEYKFQTYAAYKTDGEMKIGVVPEQEPVAWFDSKSGWTDFHFFKPVRKPSAPDAEWLPLYTAPQRREWAGLTNHEISEILCDDRWQGRPEYMLLQMQAKLKEKNA